MASLINLTVDMIGLSYSELMLIRNSGVDCEVICVRIMLLIVYFSEPFFGLFEVVRVSFMTR